MFMVFLKPDVYEKKPSECVMAVDPGPVSFAKNKPDHSVYNLE